MSNYRQYAEMWRTVFGYTPSSTSRSLKFIADDLFDFCVEHGDKVDDEMVAMLNGLQTAVDESEERI